MTQPPALPPEGWYPNPENTEQQRWWDGQAWTEHVAVGAPMAPGYEQQPEPAAYQPSYQPQQPQQPSYEQSPYGYQPQPYQGQPQQPGYPQQSGYPQYGGQPAPAGYGGYAPPPPKGVLPDGAVVVSWWWRVLARIIDNFVVGVPVTLIAIPIFLPVFRHLNDWVDRADAASRAGLPTPELRFSDLGISGWQIIVFLLIAGVVQVIYELVMLKAFAATVGKLACGLRVREWHSRGALPWGTVGKRILAGPVAAAVPQVGGLYNLVDVLWPLWDGNKQALHDKFASTAVVKKHDAVPVQQQQTYGGATGFGGYQSF